jgi:hypothetical protein
MEALSDALLFVLRSCCGRDARSLFCLCCRTCLSDANVGVEGVVASPTAAVVVDADTTDTDMEAKDGVRVRTAEAPPVVPSDSRRTGEWARKEPSRARLLLLIEAVSARRKLPPRLALVLRESAPS